MSIPSTWKRKWGRVTLGANWRRGRFVREAYEVPLDTDFSDVETAVPLGSLYGGGTHLPTGSGAWPDYFPPILEDYTIDDGYSASKSLVSLLWGPPTWGRVLEDNPNHGILSLMVSGDEVRPKYDLSTPALPVWRESWDGVTPTKCEPISGKGTVLLPRAMIRLQVVINDATLETFLAIVGACNDDTMTNMFGVAALTLRCAGAHSEHVMSGTAYSMADLLFEYNIKGWNAETEVQKYIYKVKEVPVYDENDDAIAGRFREVGSWEATEDPPYPVVLAESQDFSGIDALVGW